MATPSVLDLSFATRGIVNKIQDWQVLPDLGSDHFGILFTICNPRARTRHSLPLKEDSSRFDTKKANWNLFKETLISSTIGPQFRPNYSNQELDQLALEFTDYILGAAIASIPKTSKSSYSKPWWNEKLKAIGKVYKYFSRLAKKSNFTLYKQELLDAKNNYFNSIKEAKTKHWNLFLEKEDCQSIFKAMSYTKDTSNQPIPSIYSSSSNSLKSDFLDKCLVLRDTLFPTPPSSRPTSLENY
jgi:hypothetical protein